MNIPLSPLLIIFLSHVSTPSLLCMQQCYQVVMQQSVFDVTETEGMVSLFRRADHDGKPWFLAHDWTEAGMEIAGMEIGDTFSVDGKTYVVTAILDYEQGSWMYDVLLAMDGVILQTCDGTDGFKFVVGEML